VHATVMAAEVRRRYGERTSPYVPRHEGTIMTTTSTTPIVPPGRRAGHRLAVAAASLVALVALGACGGDPDRSVVSQTRVAPAFVPGLVEVMLSPPAEDAQRRYLERMPAPDDVREQPVVNRHDPRVTDRIATWTYRGVTVEVYHAATSDRRIPMSVRLSEPSDPVDGLFVGMSTSALTSVAGAPDERAADTWRYRVFDDPHAAPYEVLVDVDGGV